MSGCARIKKLPNEADQLRALLMMSGVKRAAIDSGVTRVNFFRNHSPVKTVPRTAGNRRLEAGEIYAAAIDLLEQEEDHFVGEHGIEPRYFTDLVSQCSTFRLPWLFTDFDKSTISDDRVLFRIARRIRRIRRGIRGMPENSLAFRTEYLRRLVKWMEGRLNRQRYVLEEQSNLEMAAGAPGDCTELSRYAYAILRLAGFKPQFLLVTQHAFNPKIRYHVCVGVPLDPDNPGQLTQVDLYHKGFLGKAHPGWVHAPKQSLLAVQEVTRGTHLIKLRDYFHKQADDMENHAPLLGLSTVISPLYRGLGHLVSGLMTLYYLHATDLDRHFPDGYYNSALTLFQMGERSRQICSLYQKGLALRSDLPRNDKIETMCP